MIQEENDFLKVAERLYYEQNPTTKMDVPSSVYETVKKWQLEWFKDCRLPITFYKWCIENKQPKPKPNEN